MSSTLETTVPVAPTIDLRTSQSNGSADGGNAKLNATIVAINNISEESLGAMPQEEKIAPKSDTASRNPLGKMPPQTDQLSQDGSKQWDNKPTKEAVLPEPCTCSHTNNDVANKAKEVFRGLWSDIKSGLYDDVYDPELKEFEREEPLHRRIKNGEYLHNGLTAYLRLVDDR